MQPCFQEKRIAELEADTKVNNNSIQSLIEQLKNLTGEVKWLIRLLVSLLIVAVGYFLRKEFGG